MVEKVKQDIRFKILKITSKDIMENDVNMLGKPYYIKPRNLVYLFLDIQQDYGIKIAEEYLKNQQFATINGIASIIMRNLDKSH
ncbi:MAG: hypothetical protein HFI59_11330 [Lachnospiraceae bacterium]|jgi:peptide maturation system acyl carrier-related protein|nr:hypothetical protein [Lachnospiraceae bacterium]